VAEVYAMGRGIPRRLCKDNNVVSRRAIIDEDNIKTPRYSIDVLHII
jgi:hypothetical protein